ncbi:hypothetical protein F4778DRAFT_781704 [Xylariomycetidae sp. FL2044]|nr:hypothetical protein F4778DRAFT_781704 [Xylariomycetidae sp. FL2044]
MDFCHGYEKRGAAAAAILAEGPLSNAFLAPIFAADATPFTKRVRINTHGNVKLASEIAGVLAEKQLKDVEFDSGPDDVLSFLGHAPESLIDRTLPDQLGCECDPKVGIKVSLPFNATPAAGVFAAGDRCSPLKSVLTGMSAGSFAAVGVARHLAGFFF